MATLSKARVRAAKPKDKPYKIFDERGLYLRVELSGGRLWRFRYRHGGKEKLLSLGSYPGVSLQREREKRDEVRKLVADGIDPSAERQKEKLAQTFTFEAIADEWLGLQSKKLAEETQSILRSRLKIYLYPYIGARPIDAITAPELLAALRKTEARAACLRASGRAASC